METLEAREREREREPFSLSSGKIVSLVSADLPGPQASSAAAAAADLIDLPKVELPSPRAWRLLRVRCPSTARPTGQEASRQALPRSRGACPWEVRRTKELHKKELSL